MICYYDENDNNTYDGGEEVKVFHLAEVGIVVNPTVSSVTTDSTHFAVRPFDNLATIVQDGSFNGPFAIGLSQTVQVVGGGSNGEIGVDQVHLGFIQDGTSNNVAIAYQNGRTASVRLEKGTYPILDATYPANARDPGCDIHAARRGLGKSGKIGSGTFARPGHQCLGSQRRRRPNH